MYKFIGITSLSLTFLCATATAQDPLRVWKAETKFHGRMAKGLVKAETSATGEQLASLVDNLDTGATQPEDIADEVARIANDAVSAIEAIIDQEVRAVETFTSAAILAPPVPQPLIVGACTLISKFMDAMNKLQLKANQVTLKDIKKAIKFIERITGHQVAIVLIPPPPVPPPAPAPAAPIPPAPRPIKITAMAAASDVNAQNDGKACIGGTADPTVNGGMINVRITGPGGASTQTVAIDPATGKWRACFPPAGVGNLPEGNYRVEVDQGGPAKVRGTIGVPG